MYQALLFTVLMIGNVLCFSPNGVVTHQHNYNFCRLNSGGAHLEHEEPLSVIFQRAVVLQRSGELGEALKDYELFIKAAKQCDVSPEMYAEVHVNIGAVYFKEKDIQLARHHFKRALEYRQVGTAYVNLALIALQEGSKTMDPKLGILALREAKMQCVKAIELGDTPQSKATATGLLEKIEGMLERMT